MKCAIVAAAALAVLTQSALADVIVLSNGDTLNGKIGQVTSSGLEFESPSLGKLNIPIGKVSKYTFDEPVRVQPKQETAYVETVRGEGSQATVGDRTYALGELKYINPGPQEWNGAAIGNFALARGNTNKFTIGAEAKAALRRDDEWNNDRFALAAAYNFGRTGGGAGGEPTVTDTDNWNVAGKWDKFWTEKLYGYLNAKLEHDDIANLYYRATPGVGIGYQWLEGPKTIFSTEGGLTYVHETYLDPDTGDRADTNDNISLRLAWHLEHKLSDSTSLFHNLEVMPAVDDFNDYILNADVGLKMIITGNFIAQFKLDYRRDNTPAEDSLKNDLLWTVGLGWQF